MVLGVLVIVGCESKRTPAAASATAATSAPPLSGVEGKYMLDAVSYGEAMAKSWAGRFTAEQVAEMKTDLKASGWVELLPGGKAKTNLTTAMGDGPETAVVTEGTWTQRDKMIDITPSDPAQGKALSCTLDSAVPDKAAPDKAALACTAGGPAMVFVRSVKGAK